MTAASVKTRQGLVQQWAVQMVGTLVIAGAIYLFTRSGMPHLGTLDGEWKRYALYAVLAAGLPAVLYVRHFKRLLLQDERLERERQSPHPEARTLLSKSLAVGGALCELPMAIGVLQLLLGGEQRVFIGSVFVTFALRLSYRPFTRKP